jgi:hypothetical protein
LLLHWHIDAGPQARGEDADAHADRHVHWASLAHADCGAERAHGDPATNAYAVVPSDAHADPGGHAHAHAKHDADGDANAFCDADRDGYTIADLHAVCHSDVHADQRSDQYAHEHTDHRSDHCPNGYTDERADGNAYVHSVTNEYFNAGGNPICVTDGDAYADRDTDGHPIGRGIDADGDAC